MGESLDGLVKEIEKSLELVEDKYQPKGVAKAKGILEKYFEYSPQLAREIVRQTSWYMAHGYIAMLDFSKPENIEYLYLNSSMDFYQYNYQKLTGLDPALALIISQKVGASLKKWMHWPWKEIKKFAGMLIDFSDSTNPLVPAESQAGLLGFFGDLTLRTRPESYSVSSDGKHLNKITQISGTYLESLKLCQSDKLGFGKTLLERITTKYCLPFPNPESGEMKIDEKKYLDSIFKREKSQPAFGSVFEQIEKAMETCFEQFEEIGKICKLYHQYFEGVEEIKNAEGEVFLVPELVQTAMPFLEGQKHDVDELGNLFRIIGSERCQTLDEVVKCANLSVPDYEVVSAIKRSNFGNIFLIQQGGNLENVRYALKIVGHKESMGEVQPGIQEFLLEHDIVELTRRESEINAMLIETDHPNIVRFFEQTSVNYYGKDLPAIKMEYISGVTLRDYFGQREGKRLSSRDTVRIFAQIFDGLGSIHQQGIKCMGDLRPENVMVDDKGQVKLIDFGLAWTKTEKAPSSGKVSYMAPEILCKSDDVCNASDWWSVGMMLYCALAGEELISGNGKKVRKELRQMYKDKEISEACPKKINNNIKSAFFREFITKLLSPSVKERENIPEDYFRQVKSFEEVLTKMGEETITTIRKLRGRSLDSLIREGEDGITETPLVSFQKKKEKEIGKERGVERQEEYEKSKITLEKVLDSKEPVVIFGHGGQGKTILATEIARRLLNNKLGEKYSHYLPVIVDCNELNSKVRAAEAKTPKDLISLIRGSAGHVQDKLDPRLLKDCTRFVYLIDDYQKVNPDYDEVMKKAVGQLAKQEAVVLFSRLERADLRPPMNKGYLTIQIDGSSIPATIDGFIEKRIPNDKREEFKSHTAQYDESITGNYITLHVLTMIFRDPERVLRYYQGGHPLHQAVKGKERLTATQLYDIQTDFVVGNEIERNNPGWPLAKVKEEIGTHKKYLAELAFRQVMKE